MLSSKYVNNTQAAHEESTTCYLSKMSIIHKLLMKNPPVAAFQRYQQYTSFSLRVCHLISFKDINNKQAAHEESSTCYLPKISILHKLLINIFPLLSSKDINNTQAAHEESATCYHPKISIIHKLLMKSPPLSISQRYY